MKKTGKMMSGKFEKVKVCCDFCNEYVYSLRVHNRACKDRLAFMKWLDKKGIAEREDCSGGVDIWVSGAMKVLLILRGVYTTSDYLELARRPKKRARPKKGWPNKLDKESISALKNLLAFETEHGMRLEYVSKTDKLSLKISRSLHNETKGERQ